MYILVAAFQRLCKRYEPGRMERSPGCECIVLQNSYRCVYIKIWRRFQRLIILVDY